MKLDCHIHAGFETGYLPHSTTGDALMSKLKAANLDGGIVFSADPVNCGYISPRDRMQDTLDLCKPYDTLFPFYWIDPMDEYALIQVEDAIEKGFVGFKMICSHYPVTCHESMDVLRLIAANNKPVLFHSGISWDGMNSANYNRPGNFEAMLDIPNLRFALAHISWPWCDECFAVYGKLLNARRDRPDCCEMFIDVTPGTPRAYREEVFAHMFGCEYDIKNNLLFGTDGVAGTYNPDHASQWQEIDNALYRKFVQDDPEDFMDHVYGKNLLRFIGLREE